jgi:hypothetical protein
MIGKSHLVLLAVYGIILCIVAFFVAGFGHGSYLLLGLAGAPFSAISIPLAFLASVLQWPMIPIVCSRFSFGRRLMAGFLIIHYVSAAVILLWPTSEYADLGYLTRMPRDVITLFVVGVIWYLGGQAFLWIRTLKGLPAHKSTG